jgi:pimeloyl-ACP methyl ester carboxylesterase
VPTLDRPDGIELHTEERGDGPPVVIAAYWSMHPSSFEPLIAELQGDYRVITYHDRGNGSSTRTGPYDLDTSSADLEAVIEEVAGPDTIVVATADGSTRAVKVVARRPDLVRAVVTVGGAPVGRAAIGEFDAMVGSETVVDAFIAQVATDYRSALRGILTATNKQLDEDELRRRVAIQLEHSPADAAVERLRSWAADDPTALAREAGDRLWFLWASGLGGGWFPDGADYERMIRRELPDSHLVPVDDGFISRPDQVAAVVREITAPAAAVAERS